MSRQSTATDTLPQEIWLRIFALVDSTKSLGCVVLVCRKFHILGTEALVRHVGWRSSTVAIHHMEFWDRNPSKTHLVRSVSLSLAGCDNENGECLGLRCIHGIDALEQTISVVYLGAYSRSQG
jgi:hypothetical protein